MKRGNNPYKKLGERLYEIRKGLKESLVEVSGAVELESDIIERYERGETRPSEDVLELLIRHFDVREDEAEELWELAGYVEQSDNSNSSDMPQLMQMPTIVVMPTDNRIVYVDSANVSVNKFGVVINFQQSGPNGQQTAVSRVGMSIEHAKSVLEVLSKTIEQAESKGGNKKQLPESSDNKQ